MAQETSFIDYNQKRIFKFIYERYANIIYIVKAG